MKVAIIGAGASGLTSIKWCLEEEVIPVCFERTNYIGGLWRYEPKERCGSSVYKSTVINTSKEMMCFSDYPIPEDYPNFMHNTKIYEYFQSYAKNFDLYKHIQFNTDVLKCEKATDFKTSGKWVITTRKVENDEESVDIFDGVLVCIGHHAIPHYPLNEFAGIEKFKGSYIHSHSYRTPEGYSDKRVLVVGIGNSGLDIAVELAGQAKQVYLSTRRGAWIFNRVSDNGFPIDINTARLSAFLTKHFPNAMATLAERQLNTRFDHEMYGLKPNHRINSQHATVNDDLPNKLLNGTVKAKVNVREFTETQAIFEDGSAEDIDCVVFATGYKYEFPFLSKDILQVKKNSTNLYKLVWPENLEQNTLAVLGNIQPLGAINPISELQVRCALKVMKKKTTLPSANFMKQEIETRRAKMAALFVESPRHTLEVDYVAYMDELADIIHCKPDVGNVFMVDPKLALKIFFGPTTPYQYRLDGPNKWSGARQAIMTQMYRIKKPLNTRGLKKDTPGSNSFNIAFIVIILAILYFYYF